MSIPIPQPVPSGLSVALHRPPRGGTRPIKENGFLPGGPVPSPGARPRRQLGDAPLLDFQLLDRVGVKQSGRVLRQQRPVFQGAGGIAGKNVEIGVDLLLGGTFTPPSDLAFRLASVGLSIWL